MPNQAFRDVAYPQETGEAFVALLTIEHDDLPTTILLTDAGTDIVYAADLLDANGNVAALAGTYVAMPIAIVPPGQSDEQLNGKITIPNIDMRIGEAVDSISTPARITITAVLASQPEVIVGGPHLMLELMNVRGDALVVEGEVSRPALTVEPYPKHWLRPSVFRAAFRIS
jgi:hypothetical protein